MVVLRGQRVVLVCRDFITASSATIDAGVWDHISGAVLRVVCRIVGLIQQASVFVLCHKKEDVLKAVAIPPACASRHRLAGSHPLGVAGEFPCHRLVVVRRHGVPFGNWRCGRRGANDLPDAALGTGSTCPRRGPERDSALGMVLHTGRIQQSFA